MKKTIMGEKKAQENKEIKEKDRENYRIYT